MCLFFDVVVVIKLIWMMIYNLSVTSYVSHWCSHLLERFYCWNCHEERLIENDLSAAIGYYKEYLEV